MCFNYISGIGFETTVYGISYFNLENTAIVRNKY